MGRGFGEEGGRKEGLKDALRLRFFCRSINDHDHLEIDMGTKARFGGCIGHTEAWDMTKGAPLALTLMNYEQTNFASDGRGVTVPAFRNSKNRKNRFFCTTRRRKLAATWSTCRGVLINSWTKWDSCNRFA